jgi:hypothetical protein
MQKVKARTERALEGQPVNCLPLETLRAIKGVEELIHCDEVDIGLASDFSKNHWKIYSRIDADHTDEISTDRYGLSQRLLDATGRHLLELRKDEKNCLRLGYKPCDILVIPLCRAAQTVGRPSQEPDDDSDWLEKQPIWEIGHPISEAWTDLDKLPVPWDVEASLRLDSHTKKWVTRPPRQGKEDADEVQERMRAIAKTGGNRFFKSPPPERSDQTDRFVVCISRKFQNRKSELPKLTIEVEGAPVCQLMKTFQTKQKSTDKVFKEAQALQDAIKNWMGHSMGPRKIKPGRQSMGKGYKAAFLHDHEGLSWAQVAKKLSPLDNSAHSRETLRKQAEQYWKRLRKMHNLPR